MRRFCWLGFVCYCSSMQRSQWWMKLNQMIATNNYDIMTATSTIWRRKQLNGRKSISTLHQGMEDNKNVNLLLIFLNTEQIAWGWFLWLYQIYHIWTRWQFKFVWTRAGQNNTIFRWQKSLFPNFVDVATWGKWLANSHIHFYYL